MCTCVGLCDLGLLGLGMGHGGRKLSPKTGPLTTGGTIKPVCWRILRQGTQYQGRASRLHAERLQKRFGGGRMMVTECFKSPFHSELETTLLDRGAGIISTVQTRKLRICGVI